MANLRVLRAGLSTTIQDVGRRGFQRFGVPTSGALDMASLHAANLLVGNAPDTAALEICYTGPRLILEAQSARLACVGGGDATIKLHAEANDPAPRNLKTWESICLHKGQIVDVGPITGSSVLYMAVEGGFDIAPVLGSRSTFERGGLGGLHGRALRLGDSIPLASAEAGDRRELRLPRQLLATPARIRIMAGPQAHYFAPDAISRLCDAPYTIGPDSNRMGMRLEGAEIAHSGGYDITSEAVAPGSIQIPGTRKPVVLLADRQTTGGYPKIATIISADLAALGRMPIGATFGFELVTANEAHQARRLHLESLAAMSAALAPVAWQADEVSVNLFNSNLVSGVCYASI